MKTITSKENPLLKSTRKLAASSRERKKAGKTLLDGIHLVAAYHQAGGLPEAIMVSVSAQDHPEIRDFLHNVPPENLIVLGDELFRDISTVETPTGIVALIRIPQPAEREADCCVLLEDIQDPGNLGSILRSSAAAGIGRIHLSPGCTDAWSPKVLRAAWEPIFICLFMKTAICWLLRGIFRGKWLQRLWVPKRHCLALI